MLLCTFRSGDSPSSFESFCPFTLSTGFSMQEHWSRFPLPAPVDQVLLKHIKLQWLSIQSDNEKAKPLGCSNTAGGNVKWYSHCVTIWLFLKKKQLNIHLNTLLFAFFIHAIWIHGHMICHSTSRYLTYINESTRSYKD